MNRLIKLHKNTRRFTRDAKHPYGWAITFVISGEITDCDTGAKYRVKLAGNGTGLDRKCALGYAEDWAIQEARRMILKPEYKISHA